jgi:mannitol-specific phosphotransferase system IIBC component
MCAAAVPIIGALVGAAATIHAANAASDDAAKAREQQERQMQLAREQQAQAPAASQTTQDVTAAVQANRRRAAVANGMGSTITGAGTQFNEQQQQNTSSGLAFGTKKNLGA